MKAHFIIFQIILFAFTYTARADDSVTIPITAEDQNGFISAISTSTTILCPAIVITLSEAHLIWIQNISV